MTPDGSDIEQQCEGRLMANKEFKYINLYIKSKDVPKTNNENERRTLTHEKL